MKIVAMIPLFKEPMWWIKQTIENTSLYADDVVICVNDTYNHLCVLLFILPGNGI